MQCVRMMSILCFLCRMTRAVSDIFGRRVVRAGKTIDRSLEIFAAQQINSCKNSVIIPWFPIA